MNASRRRHYVTLSRSPQTSGDSDGFFEDLNPPDAWCSIEPAGPGTSDGTRMIGLFVTMPYHVQVGLDTRVLFGSRQLFVRGVQNVDERNLEMRLYCEEAV